ncbi:MAG TPA: hypothetical protein PK014_10405 [Thermoanaerobaculia bacterium]|nr:hypothetical protein [Thermoanaerobaculia bacterium]HUM30531.1 hypothetical protein [Thermoanaerobaculia bacterium]HXK68723.1 hypothetical protein [Thermoanaerobaculia bacterium]
MIIRLSVDGQEVAVEVCELPDGRFEVMFPEERIIAELREGYGYTQSLIDDQGRQFEMTLREEGNGNIRIGLGSEGMIVTAMTELEYRARQAREGEEDRSGWELKASLPGKIKRILVTPGDAVDGGTPLMIMEAMKMENEIRAERPGIIRTVPVEEGKAVETGAVLVTADPVDSTG